MGPFPTPPPPVPFDSYYLLIIKSLVQIDVLIIFVYFLQSNHLEVKVALAEKMNKVRSFYLWSIISLSKHNICLIVNSLLQEFYRSLNEAVRCGIIFLLF